MKRTSPGKAMSKLILCCTVIVVIALLMPSVAKATDGSDFGYKTTGADTVEITGYFGSAQEVSIPASISGKKVTSIGDKAFQYHYRNLTKITIPNGVTSIGDWAFFDCYDLSTVSIPNSVTSIGLDAFCGCGSLQKISLPNQLTAINSLTFCGCYSLTSIVIPDSVTTIYEYAFAQCSGLADISIPSKVALIESDAFMGCTQMSRAVFLGDVPQFGDQVFTNMRPGFKIYYHISRSSNWAGMTEYPKQAYCMVTINLQNGHEPAKVITNVNSSHITSPVSSTKTGYTFKGWFKDAEYSTIWDFDEDVVTGDIAVYAKWAINIYVVHFNYGDGRSVVNSSAKYSATIPEPATPTRTGYSFAGWYKDSHKWDFSTDVVTAETTLFAKWTANKYTITFDAQGGTVTPANLSAVFGQAYGTLPIPAQTGYTFGGWYTAPNGAGTKILNTSTVSVASNHTLYAKWIINTYTVSFNSQTGTTVPSNTAPYNTTILAPTAPTRTGYTFLGWYKDSACAKPWVFATDKVTANITLYAGWKINTYTVIFNAQLGTTVPNKTAIYNTKIAAPTPPTRAGYVFMGWYKESTCTHPWVFATDKVTANTTLYARWVSTVPAGVKAISASSTSIKITWNAVPKAAGYTVYRSTTKAGKYQLVQSTTTLSFTNTGLIHGKTYYYIVKSYHMEGKVKVYSQPSAIVSANP